MNHFYIYKYTSPSGKSYIGQTNNPTKRKCSHKNAKNGCRAFSAAIDKYGFDNFTYTILEKNLTSSEANILEEYYIKTFNTLSPNGYNLKNGGNNKLYSNESKALMSKKQIGNTNASGNKGKAIPISVREQISKTMKTKNIGENNPMYGYKFDENTLKARAEKTAKKYKITFPDGHIEVIKNLSNFCKEHSLDNTAMTKLAKGIFHKHRGYSCEYAIHNQ